MLPVMVKACKNWFVFNKHSTCLVTVSLKHTSSLSYVIHDVLYSQVYMSFRFKQKVTRQLYIPFQKKVQNNDMKVVPPGLITVDV
jgi:hypothetical protein